MVAYASRYSHGPHHLPSDVNNGNTKMKRTTKKVTPKKKRGRPATGRDPVMTVRLPPELVESMDRWAKENGYPDRSSAIRALIERGMD
jgi:Ribbon-helix-helix protein, copG family